LKRGQTGNAAFETLEGARSRVMGSLEFATVTRPQSPAVGLTSSI
jgi:hypothetical protein